MPTIFEIIDDTFALLSEKHNSVAHRRDLNQLPYEFVDPVPTLTRVYILEVIEPGDPRYRNHLRWARGIVHGKVIFVRTYGLKNTAY